jgi:hypothetical protein
MKALRQLGFLKLNFRPDKPPEEDTRVLELFRNRAELKKAYADLQDETFRLKDLIKQQEGATQRAQDMLSGLEGRLGVAETAYPTLVFYQLRRLWQSGREQVTQFVADLARQQEERERREHLAQHNRRQFGLRDSAEKQLLAAQALHLEAGAQVEALQGERARLTRFWHYFKRRALERRIDAAQAALDSAAAALSQAQGGLDEVAREPTPEFPGLSLATRRSINLAGIAYAEALCLRLAELKTPLTKLARDAIASRDARDDYGTPRECVLLMGNITRANRLIADRAGFATQIRDRGERLKKIARYRGANDSTPLAESLAHSEDDVLAGLPAAIAAQLPNVLSEDTWDLFRILLR